MAEVAVAPVVEKVPAGPAFEGAQIRFGMRASDGAIEGVHISPDGVSLQIIGGALRPVGICGSGLVDAVAELRHAQAARRRRRHVDVEECLGREADLGTVEPGKLADLIVVDGDPVKEPGLLCDRDRIWLRGERAFGKWDVAAVSTSPVRL